MFTVANNGIVIINRGDTFECPLFIAMSTFPDITRYELKPSDVLTFNIVYPGTGEYIDGETSEIDELEPVLQHIYSEDGGEGHIVPEYTEAGDVIIRFSAEEMKKLQAGTYYYEAILHYTLLNNNRVDTVIPRTKLRIME